MHPVWLGGLLNPEAYITATRQCVAQANSWSLEELQLDVTIMDASDKSNVPSDCFAVIGKFAILVLSGYTAVLIEIKEDFI